MQKLLEFYINLYDKLLIKKDLIYKTNDLDKKGFLLKDYKIMYNEFEGIWSNLLLGLENKKQDVIDLEILGGWNEKSKKWVWHFYRKNVPIFKK